MTEIGSRSVVLLIPLMAVFVKLFNRRKRVYFVEALVFCLHLHAFPFMLLSTQLTAHDFARSVALAAAIPVSIFYTVRALQVAFAGTFFISAFKSLVILGIHFIIVMTLSVAVSIGILLMN